MATCGQVNDTWELQNGNEPDARCGTLRVTFRQEFTPLTGDIVRDENCKERNEEDNGQEGNIVDVTETEYTISWQIFRC